MTEGASLDELLALNLIKNSGKGIERSQVRRFFTGIAQDHEQPLQTLSALLRLQDHPAPLLKPVRRRMILRKPPLDIRQRDREQVWLRFDFVRDGLVHRSRFGVGRGVLHEKILSDADKGSKDIWLTCFLPNGGPALLRTLLDPFIDLGKEPRLKISLEPDAFGRLIDASFRARR